MSDTRYVDCAEHGQREATFVCQHVVNGQGLGFHQGFGEDDPDAVFPDAWCDGCEAVRNHEGGWNERSEAVASIKILCSGCYLKRRILNWPRSTHAEQAELIRRSVEYLEAQQDVLRREYRLDEHERYGWDQDSGLLTFSSGGRPAVLANFQFVGSISTRTDTWLWSWANKSDLEPVRAQIRNVRAYGEDHRLLKLACAYWLAKEEDGWEMAAVAAYILQAKGAYRSPDEHKFEFMVLTDVRWAQ